jgi:branched-chain amino acid aminotransferase
MEDGPRQVWLDGGLVPAGGPHLRVSDRGFQLGDGIFETLRARRGVLVDWAEHLARLGEGAAALSLSLPPGDGLEAAVRELLVAEGLADPGRDGTVPSDAAVRITISRGPLPGRGTLPTGWRTASPTVVVQAWPHSPPPADLISRGVRAVTSAVRRDPGSPLVGIKATSRADHVFAKLEAERAGVDDALFLTTDGRVSEATSANVFAVVGRRLLTPPLSAAILAGTTRTWLLSHPAAARAVGLEAEARDLRPIDLIAADEAFLTSSVAGILPLVELDGRPIGDGRPGERVPALRAAREDWIDELSLGAPR